MRPARLFPESGNKGSHAGRPDCRRAALRAGVGNRHSHADLSRSLASGAGRRSRRPSNRRSSTRTLGPDIILLIEKKDLSSLGIKAARHFGISRIITAGVSRIAPAEFFCAALRAVYSGPVRILVYGDFDPGGRVVGTALTDHFARFGVPCPRGPEFLITPDLFSSEEIGLFSRPLTQADGRVDDFVAETGGIQGQPRGIHAD